MVRCGLLALMIVLAACSGMSKNRSVADGSHLVGEYPQIPDCRLGSTPVCKMSDREGIKTCRCMQLPYNLTGGRSFGTAPRRH
jgi:hypothetical protein